MIFLYGGIFMAFVVVVYFVCMAFVRHDEKKRANRRTHETAPPAPQP